MTTHTVSTVFDDYAAAVTAIRQLEALGFSHTQINILSTEEGTFKFEKATKVPEGTAVGGVSGGVIGALLGALTAVGSIVVPGVGLVAAGTVVSALAGGALGATAGGLVGALVGLGIPEREAKLYEKHITEGSVLLAVQAESEERAEQARKVFENTDGQQIAA